MRFRSTLITGATMGASLALVAMANPAFADSQPNPKQDVAIPQTTTQTITDTIRQTNTLARQVTNNVQVNKQNLSQKNASVTQNSSEQEVRQ